MQSRARCQKGIDAFEKTVYAHIRRDCRDCHDDGGFSEISHSSHDILKSYQRVISYVNWSNVDDSFFIKKGGNLHCLKYPQEGKCSSDEKTLRELVHQWWESGQKDCPLIGALVSRPTKLNQSSEPMEIRIDISNLAQVGGLKFEFTAHRENDEYVLSRPRILGESTAIRIKGIGMVQNGRPLTLINGWQSVSVKVLPNTKALLSAITVRVPVELGAEDEISFGFQSLEKVEPFSCQKLTAFENDVLPVLSRRRCYSCHGGGPDNALGIESAHKQLNMNLPIETLCIALWLRGQSGVESPLIALSLRGMLGHPRSIVLATDIFPAWMEWIRGETLGEKWR